MLEWITQNFASLIILALVATIIVLVTFKMIKDRRQGKSSCACGCSGCAMKDTCHSKK